jgi:hypothetical protein
MGWIVRDYVSGRIRRNYCRPTVQQSLTIQIQEIGAPFGYLRVGGTRLYRSHSPLYIRQAGYSPVPQK